MKWTIEEEKALLIENKQKLIDELTAELERTIPTDTINAIREYELEENKTATDYLEEFGYDIFKCYCSKKFQFTFDSNKDTYQHIIDCDFKNGITNEVSEMIAGQIKE